VSTKTYKTLETPSGSGELRKAGKHLAKVFYHLQVQQEMTADESVAGAEKAPGIFEVAGEVTVSQDEPNQAQVVNSLNSGELLTLHLADGRQLDVYATQGDRLTGTYRIVSGSPAGFTSEERK
jgi:hypothetical protein